MDIQTVRRYLDRELQVREATTTMTAKSPPEIAGQQHQQHGYAVYFKHEKLSWHFTKDQAEGRRSMFYSIILLALCDLLGVK